jgi:hypothetical protein
MPLPDADKKSPRVYTLSQNTDLENMAFATLQSIGEPINIEELNEDELRRLVLVNLARLAVKGEWNGLLTAGGSEFNVELPKQSASTYSTSYMVNVATAPPYGSNTVQGGGVTTDMECWPFISPNSGNISKMYLGVNATVTNTVSMAIYSDNDGVPETLLGYGDFDLSASTGSVSQTSFSATITLTRGTQYWYAMKSSSANQPNMKKVDTDICATIGLGDSLAMTSTGKYMSINTEVAHGDALPSTITIGNATVGNFSGRPMFGLEF